jgi:hypothetical protein
MAPARGRMPARPKAALPKAALPAVLRPRRSCGRSSGAAGFAHAARRRAFKFTWQWQVGTRRAACHMCMGGAFPTRQCGAGVRPSLEGLPNLEASQIGSS